MTLLMMFCLHFITNKLGVALTNQRCAKAVNECFLNGVELETEFNASKLILAIGVNGS